MVSVDSNIKYQQSLPNYRIARLVLRALKNSEPRLKELMPVALETISKLQPGEVVYLFTQEMKEIAARRGHTFKH